MFRVLAPLLLFACSCQAVATQASRPPTSPLDKPAAVLSLFSSDEAVMTDLDIARILDAKWEIPAHIRIAVIPFGHRSTYGYRLPQPGMETSPDAIEVLRGIPGVFDVSYLPKFLQPLRHDVAHIREAAARYQADWVLLYSSQATSSPKMRFFGPDEVHGVALVECALLDTRTGLIAFTARSTETFEVIENPGGESWALLIERAEREAVDRALVADANLIVKHVANAR